MHGLVLPELPEEPGSSAHSLVQMHAPDQTDRRPRLLHCLPDLDRKMRYLLDARRTQPRVFIATRGPPAHWDSKEISSPFPFPLRGKPGREGAPHAAEDGCSPHKRAAPPCASPAFFAQGVDRDRPSHGRYTHTYGAPSSLKHFTATSHYSLRRSIPTNSMPMPIWAAARTF